MPALKKTNLIGRIVYLGVVLDREGSLRSTPIEAVEARFSGLDSEDHSGLTRPSCSRVASQYSKGTEIRNTRQICIVSEEEMALVASKIGVPVFNPEWCAANLVVSGIPDFTHLPPSSRLQASSGATLTIDMENRPCHLPAPVIDEDAPGHGKAFKAAAIGLRGVTAWVEREGVLRVGDDMVLHIPDQRAWQSEN